MTLYSSRPPFNDDPKPWRNPNDGERRAHGVKWISGPDIHDPRPEFDRPQHNPTNPILTWFRAVIEDPKCGTFEQVVDDFLIYHIKGHGKREHHARKVLTRLARLA